MRQDLTTHSIILDMSERLEMAW